MHRADEVSAEVIDRLSRAASQAYYGEPVTQLEHALQSAQLAREANSDDETVIAALLHDIGHLLDDGRLHEQLGVVDHDTHGAAWLAMRGFSPRVVELVQGHVAAKRYLVATNPEYRARLSNASVQTLELQGGAMTEDEVREFAASPLFKEKLRMRSWDEQAKVPGAKTEPLESYRELLTQHISSGPASVRRDPE
ncbi:MAG: HDIG domain-containing protein [Bryobacteraceae bacterium]|nr:HDIG domain-containing protein [Bryobacteraceae bacterium]